MLARERVSFSALQALMAVNALAQVFLDWLITWNAHDVKQWDLGTIVIWFLFAVTNYFLCVAAAPEGVTDERIDLEAFYWRNRRLFYGILVLMDLIGLAANFAFLSTSQPGLFLQTTLWTLPSLAPPLLALSVKAPWAQWLSSITLLAISITWGVLFTSSLK